MFHAPIPMVYIFRSLFVLETYVRMLVSSTIETKFPLPDALAVVRPTGFTCWIYFALVFNFIPYLSLNSFLYIDLYVLGDDALISQGSFMQTKHLCVLIHI